MLLSNCCSSINGFSFRVGGEGLEGIGNDDKRLENDKNCVLLLKRQELVGNGV